MIQFENIQNTFELSGIIVFSLIVLFVLFIWFMSWRNRTLKKLVSHKFSSHLAPDVPVFKHIVKFMLICLAVVFLIIGIANPQFGTKIETAQRKGIDIVLALDVSKSMLADDIKPNRLMNARQFALNLIDELESDRVGLVVFAGNAYLQMPLTTDLSAAKMYLNDVNTDMVPTQGTALADAVSIANRSFEETEKNHKALVLVTDGEDHEGDLEAELQTAQSMGVKIFAIGVGTAKGAPIPELNKRGEIEDYIRDGEGNIVLTRLNETLITDIAGSSGGNSYLLTQGSDLSKKLMKDLAAIEQKQFEEKTYSDYEDYFQYFIMVAFVLLLLELFLSERRSALLKYLDI